MCEPKHDVKIKIKIKIKIDEGMKKVTKKVALNKI